MRGSSHPSSRRTARRAVVLVATGLVLLAIGGAFACGTSPVGVEACQKIEKVRCESAQACGLALTRPVHEGSSPEQNVAACIRYYDDQCLHGIAGPKEPDPKAVEACVDAIIQGDCAVVKAPESSPACSFLLPAPPAPADAASDAAAEAEAPSG
jgi:hypothetical protein